MYSGPGAAAGGRVLLQGHQPVAAEPRLEHQPLHGLRREVHVEDEVAERVGDRGAAAQLHSLHPVRVPANNDVGTGIDQGAADPALVCDRAGRVLRAPVRQNDHDVDP